MPDRTLHHSHTPLYQYTPLEANHIRLLKLHTGEDGAQIECTLHAVDLLAYEDIAAESKIDGWEKFQTISYVWGTSTKRVPIVCRFCIATTIQKLRN